MEEQTVTDWAADLFDKMSVDIPCPECGKNIQETIGRLKNDPKLTCPGCSFAFTINAEQFRESMGEVNKSIDDLRKNLGSK
jgi:predicted RNA-binding Zn-ribbon protein involved in translation (DUF1610 family)